MGRTVPSFRMLLEGIIEEFSVFRRAFRGEDRNAFDSLMNILIRWMLFFYRYWWNSREINSLRVALSKEGRSIISDNSK